MIRLLSANEEKCADRDFLATRIETIVQTVLKGCKVEE